MVIQLLEQMFECNTMDKFGKDKLCLFMVSYLKIYIYILNSYLLIWKFKMMPDTTTQ